MHLVYVSTGRPQIVLRGGRQYSTAIDRRPADGPVDLAATGLAGDRVSDDRNHGGPDKAVCVFAVEHYPHFAERLRRQLPAPSFGENFTTSGLLEKNVCIGDVFRVGTTMVQVTQPRQPCFKLAGKHNEPRMVDWIHETCFCGFYLRVLQPGVVTAGDSIAPVERLQSGWTVERIMRARLSSPGDAAVSAEIAGLPGLSVAWRRHFEKRQAGDEDDD